MIKGPFGIGYFSAAVTQALAPQNCKRPPANHALEILLWLYGDFLPSRSLREAFAGLRGEASECGKIDSLPTKYKTCLLQRSHHPSNTQTTIGSACPTLGWGALRTARACCGNQQTCSVQHARSGLLAGHFEKLERGQQRIAVQKHELAAPKFTTVAPSLFTGERHTASPQILASTVVNACTHGNNKSDDPSRTAR
jgi:hypothetical protein